MALNRVIWCRNSRHKGTATTGMLQGGIDDRAATEAQSSSLLVINFKGKGLALQRNNDIDPDLTFR